MPAGIVHRPAEWSAIEDFLVAASSGPALGLVEGQAGIGKTTLLLAAADEARARGFAVLSVQCAGAESVLADTALVDLLAGVDDDVVAQLPAVQQRAIAVSRTRGGYDGRSTNPREIAAGFLSLVQELARTSPVLLVIDDVQWLDISSRNIIAYAARRFSAKVGVLCAVRTEADEVSAVSWLHHARPESVVQIAVTPLTLAQVHTLIVDKLGQSLARPTVTRLREISDGNPMYALELARVIDPQSLRQSEHLPATLAELVSARVKRVRPPVRELLEVVASLAAPTLEVVAQSCGHDVEAAVALADEAVDMGILEISGNRVGFTHPLLANGVYANATPDRRRAIHRRLADVVTDPELQARHLAFGVTRADRATLRILDGAAAKAQTRGAPVAAAELSELAVALGGDTDDRRMSAARCHFSAGDAAQARRLLDKLVASSSATIRAEARTLLGVMEILEGSLTEAAAVLQLALSDAGDDRSLRTQILAPLSLALYNCGDHESAEHAVNELLAAAESLGDPSARGESLSMSTFVRFLLGHGYDEAAMAQAVALTGTTVRASVVARPSMHSSMLAAFGGRLPPADEQMELIARECVDRGEESDSVFVAFHHVLVKIWRGRFSEAQHITDEAVVHAQMLDGNLPKAIAATMQQAVQTYLGDEAGARDSAQTALAATKRSGSGLLSAWPVMLLGFLEVSLGRHDQALAALQPLLADFGRRPRATEIFVAAYLPDAAEAMIASGLTGEAQPLIDALESNGHRLDRAWMLATGARCRGALLAADGDIDGAYHATMDALAMHRRIDMPFECARTELFLGQLQRRRRRKDEAASALHNALTAFTSMNTPLWAQRARAALVHFEVPVGAELNEFERRVARLAASGMTNKAMAAELFISRTTVEENLRRIYRKLGITSRAELGRVYQDD